AMEAEDRTGHKSGETQHNVHIVFWLLRKLAVVLENFIKNRPVLSHLLFRFSNSRFMSNITDAIGYGLVKIPPPSRPLCYNRFEYQSQFHKFHIEQGSKVLDIGSGGDPFPFATHLADRFIEPTRHRSAAFASQGKPTVVCDIAHLPFRNKAFDYVFC